jgi:hypothetical protein
MKCEPCDKELFFSEMTARNAAFLYELIYAKHYSLYHCPVVPSDWHLTTQVQRKPRRR